ncbi:MAG: alpha/beta fold hydrolase, partial [Actinomycetota bacterium]
GGIFCDRRVLRELADRLAQRFTVINYDRRARGESDDTLPYSVAREIEDIDALIEAGGGTAAVYGHSSGAALALRTAASGLPVTRLVLHEPPYSSDDEASRNAARVISAAIRTAIAEDRRGDAIKAFFADQDMPADVLEGMANDPGMLSIAPTMAYDIEVMGDDTGGGIPVDLVRDLWVPTLVLAGDASGDFFMDTATHLVELLPDANLTILAGADHGARADLVAPVVAGFLTGAWMGAA